MSYNSPVNRNSWARPAHGSASDVELDLGLRHSIGRIGARVIVEFPAVTTIFVLIDAMLGQMARLFGREMPIGLLHAL